MADEDNLFEQQVVQYVEWIAGYAKIAPEFRQLRDYMNANVTCKMSAGDFAHIHDYFLAKGLPSLSSVYESRTGRVGLVRKEGGGRVIILRGLPEIGILRNIGAYYRIDPEFFRRHLEFLVSSSRDVGNRFAWPVLPSASTYIIQLRVPVIGCKPGALKNYVVNEIKAARAHSRETIEIYLKELRKSENWIPGQSFGRDHEVFDAQHFMVDQRVTIYLNPGGKNLRHWIVVIWRDSGVDTNSGCRPPWLDGYLEFLSPPRYASGKALQFQQLLKLEQPLPSDTVATNCLYALRDVLNDSAAAVNQLLNLISSKLSSQLENLSIYSKNDSVINLAQINAIHSRKILEGQLQDLRGAADFIKHQRTLLTSARISRNTQSSDGEEKADPLIGFIQSIESTESDFQFLIKRSETLISSTENVLSMAMSNATIAESKRGLEMSQNMFNFTLLASFYVPLSFVASFFGMNFVQFGQGELDLRLFFYVAVPVFFLSLTLILLDIRKYLHRFIAFWARLLRY
ncbi:hypothetical protein BDV12DRAFT_199705 [Aspergillus spectabilis]